MAWPSAAWRWCRCRTCCGTSNGDAAGRVLQPGSDCCADGWRVTDVDACVLAQRSWGPYSASRAISLPRYFAESSRSETRMFSLGPWRLDSALVTAPAKTTGVPRVAWKTREALKAGMIG